MSSKFKTFDGVWSPCKLKISPHYKLNTMKDERKLEYLEDERRKLWAKVVELEEMINNKTPEYESDARGAARKSRRI